MVILGNGNKRREDTLEIFVSLTEVHHEDDGHVPHPLISLLHLLPNVRIFPFDVLPVIT